MPKTKYKTPSKKELKLQMRMPITKWGANRQIRKIKEMNKFHENYSKTIKKWQNGEISHQELVEKTNKVDKRIQEKFFKKLRAGTDAGATTAMVGFGLFFTGLTISTGHALASSLMSSFYTVATYFFGRETLRHIKAGGFKGFRKKGRQEMKKLRTRRELLRESTKIASLLEKMERENPAKAAQFKRDFAAYHQIRVNTYNKMIDILQEHKQAKGWK